MRIPSHALSTRETNITSEDRSDAVTVTTWVTLGFLIVVFLAREVIKYTVVRKFAIDDLLILAAIIFAVGLSVTTLRLAADGLGVFGPLTLRRANNLQKAYYASNFLYIASLGFAKLSLVVFFYKIHQVQRKQRRVVLGLGIFILAWTIASLITIAFQCGFTRPWEIFTLHCYDIGSFWVVFCIIDMTTDVSLVMLSVNLVYYLKVKASRKVAVVACFAPRTLVIGASLTRLVYLFPITPHSNPAFNLWIPVILTLIQASLSIVTACIPYMRPFFYSSDAQVPDDKGSRRHIMVAEESYTQFSSNDYARGHKRGQGLSQDTTTPNSWPNSYISPRIPSPAPLSPLLPPRLTTPPNSHESTSRSPSERGLRLQIPEPDTSRARRATFMSSQTASSHALSPDCMSPVVQPFLPNNNNNNNNNNNDYFPVPLAPRSPTPPQPCHTPPNPAAYSGDESDAEPPIRNSRTRFSLFPSHQAPRYSLVHQLNPQPPRSSPVNVVEHSRSNSRSLTGATSMSRIAPQVGGHETPTTSSTAPAPPAQQQPSPAPPPSTMRKSSPKFGSTNPTVTFATIAYDDPLRIKSPPATALTTSAPTPAPLVTAPLPAVLESPQTSSQIIRQYTRPLLPSIVTQSPRRRLRSESNPTSISTTTTTLQNTPPPSHPPPTGPLPQPPTSMASPTSRPRSRSSPYQYPSPHHTSSPLVSPTSPTRQRNRRVLTPQNSSRDFKMSPVSPVSPPTPMQFWREEAFGNGAGRTAGPSVMWEEHELQAVAMGMRSPRSGARDAGVGAPLRSPRIVLQREV